MKHDEKSEAVLVGHRHTLLGNPGNLHLVSAWASEVGIALGQVATEAKSNEITAISQLLNQIDLVGTLKPIVTGKGDCVIVVKDNQPKLAAVIQSFFSDHMERDLEDLRYDYLETRDHGYSRIDERAYLLAKMPGDFAPFAPGKEWPWGKAIGDAVRVTRHVVDTESEEIRYELSICDLSGKRFGETVRGHWGIESMPSVLDVNFREYEHRTRERILGNNLGWLRQFAVTLLKRHPDKDRLRSKMMFCIINIEYPA